ncbi:YncE family protein [Streptosporangium sp. NPDC000396]|uniref:YncE family protein n=1 Tax=Streptosporangium sp. NPDC000396 TaxID=3366185 RepID=UPI0036C1C23C
MGPLACGHDAPPYGPPVCEHIRASAGPLDFVARYTGAGFGQDRVRCECRARGEAGEPIETGAICEECFGGGEGGRAGVMGRPEILEHPLDIDPAIEVTTVPAGLGPISDLAPIGGAGAAWLALCDDGRIARWECATGVWSVASRTTVSVPEGEKHQPEPVRRLHASRDGRFAAVVVDYGERGEVFDLSTGMTTMALDGGDHHAYTVPFSLAFTEHDGRTVVVHRGEWDRLDVSDPATGRLLASWEDAFFHGAVHVSPEGTYIADDCWIWHPVGGVRVWNLRHWLTEDPFKLDDPEGGDSDDDSAVILVSCEYFWDRPVVWIDDHRVALGPLGDREGELAPGARIFTLGRTGRDAGDPPRAGEVMSFAGPDGRFFSDGGLLFSASQAGLEIWDPSDGARIGVIPGFRPTHHHRQAGELVELDGERLLRWKIGPALSRRDGSSPRPPGSAA